GRSVTEGEPELHRHGQPARAREKDVRDGSACPAATRRDGIDALIEQVSGVEPASPEPRKVDAADVVHRPEEIVRRRVLECPPADVLAKGTIEDGGVVENLVA